VLQCIRVFAFVCILARACLHNLPANNTCMRARQSAGLYVAYEGAEATPTTSSCSRSSRPSVTPHTDYGGTGCFTSHHTDRYATLEFVDHPNGTREPVLKYRRHKHSTVYSVIHNVKLADHRQHIRTMPTLLHVEPIASSQLSQPQQPRSGFTANTTTTTPQ